MSDLAVTGASGFIGRHVVEELQRRGLDATLMSASRPAGDASATFRSVRANIGDAADIDGLFEKLGRPKTLLHLAWGGLPNYNSPHHFEIELPNQYGFLDALLAQGVERVVVAGTCLEYGNVSGALREDMTPRPTTPYGFAKNSLRQMLEFRQSTKPFELVWGRLFYIFGNGQNEKSIYSQLQAAVAAKAASFPMSKGEQIRDFSPASDVARRLVALCLEPQAHGVVNICSGVPRSVRSLVEGWIKENGWDIALDLGRFPYPDYEPLAFWGDATKLNRITGYKDTSAP